MSVSILDLFTADIRIYAEALLYEGKCGICSQSVRVSDAGSGCATITDEPCADRFKVIIPYAGSSLTWEVIFNSYEPSEPPDFIFSDENFTPEICDIKSLLNWEPAEPRCLIYVIDELLREYKSYQLSLIHTSSRIQFEYTSLLEHTQLTVEQIEPHVGQNAEQRCGPINFMIKLPVDFAKLPAYITKDNPGEDYAILLVTFHSADGTKITPKLFLSPKVEHCFGGSAMLRIPHFPIGSCLMDYIPTVCELLQNKVDQVVSSYEKRQAYVCAFLDHFGGSVVEYDMEAFKKISFLMEVNDFHFIISIDLPAHFPQSQPCFTFHSIYHLTRSGVAYSTTSNAYPYSPRWSANEMAARSRAHILDYLPTFKEESVTKGSFK